MNNEEIITALNHLIEICKDGEYGFNECARHTSTSGLSQVLQLRAVASQRAADELQALVQEHGGTPERHGSLIGAVHRGWVTVRSGLSSNDDLAMLEECERGEDRAEREYGKALGLELPEPVREVVIRQYESLISHHDQIRSLRDMRKAA
ncbi:PA2169 family four-helix-bundle protein [Chitinimonas sp.]|uniref:PA2169 family four-helix-bundle protein n=1 Tax=Chitinimonas sp. TaxID=1934313 RepID=UPI002F9510C9